MRRGVIAAICGTALAALLGAGTVEAASCGAIGGNYCSQNGRCPGGYTSLGGTDDCHPCCQAGPSCGAIGGDYCSQSGGCPAGYESFGQTYDCNPCCKFRGLPTCSELGGECFDRPRCPRGWASVGKSSDCRACCVYVGDFPPEGPPPNEAGEAPAPEAPQASRP